MPASPRSAPIDPRFVADHRPAGRPPLRRAADGFAGLAAIVVSQQLSTASAGAIWGRLAAAFDPFEPAAILRARPAQLARLGLSAPKIRALKAIARAVARGELELAALVRLSPPKTRTRRSPRCTASARGPPTSICCPASAMPMPGRPATSPCRKRRGLPSICPRGRPPRRWRRSPKHWRPWRAVAARVLWTYYRAVKGARRRSPVAADADKDRPKSKPRKAKMAAELDGPRLAPRSGAARQLVVFLHGYGADGNDLIEIGRAWQQSLPHAAFVSPHAPEPCGQAPVGRQWFPLTFRDPNERWIGVNKAAPVLERFLDAELARHKLPPSALALVGFSQGTMMALHVGLRRAVAPAAIVGYSGLLVLPPDVDARSVRRRDQIAAAGAAGPWRPRRPDSAAGAVPGDAGARRARRAGRVASLARHRPRHRRRRPAPWRRVSGPQICRLPLTAKLAEG